MNEQTDNDTAEGPEPASANSGPEQAPAADDAHNAVRRWTITVLLIIAGLLAFILLLLKNSATIGQRQPTFTIS